MSFNMYIPEIDVTFHNDVLSINYVFQKIETNDIKKKTNLKMLAGLFQLLMGKKEQVQMKFYVIGDVQCISIKKWPVLNFLN